ncbi:MAG: ATP-binding protein [Lachnospiraceae bacterium]|nr:ATP-binding protein [Lachnospiraceae bacterium]
MSEEKTYLDNNGVLHCAVCKEPLERILSEPVLERTRFPRACACQRAQMEQLEKEMKDRQHEAQVSAFRAACFHDKSLCDMTFEHDDGKVPAMEKAKSYVDNWDMMRRKDIGLLLWGGVGTGKTYMAAAIANALIDKEVRVLMTDFATISNISVLDAEEYMKALMSYDLLIIDDLGAERNTEFAVQNVFNVINRRWLSRKPMIITTNLTLDLMKETAKEDVNKCRIYDRILDVCKPVLVDGASKRTESGLRRMDLLREVFE